jgi:lactoylglutathione lyase
MTINHLNLTVTDPGETSAFLAKYFGLQPRGGNAGMQMLYDDQRMVLTLIKGRADDRDQSEGANGKPARVKYPSSFHIGFIVESQDRVNQINQQLRDDGLVRTRRRSCMGPGPSISRRLEDSPSK